jgi:hypothetical protein
MSFNFYLNETVVLQQNTALFVQDITPFPTNTNFKIDVNFGSTLNALFENHTYTQNELDENDYNVVLNVQNSNLANRLNDAVVLLGGTSSLSVETSSSADDHKKFYIRLLEIMALEIFGHAQARAAIANDTDFKAKHNDIINHVWNEFNKEGVQNDFFEQYVQLDRVDLSQNDVSGHVMFNLDDSRIDFTAFLNGALEDATLPSANLATFFGANGRDAEIDDDGYYNISLLVTLNGISAPVAALGGL